MKLAVIGGGLTGLSAAYYIGKAHPDWTIAVYEQTNRFGGKVKTTRQGDYAVEMGPDSYLARKTAMTDLIVELGLGDKIVRNATGAAYIYDRGRMKPIPGGSIIGIPTEFLPFATSSLLTWGGKLRALWDYTKKPYPKPGDVSIGEFFHYHLGQEMMDKLIEPLLSGIYGGNIYELSLDATFPDFHRLEQKYGNMVKGMMAMKAQQAGRTTHVGQFAQLIGGLETVIDAICEQMPKNVSLHKECQVEDILYEQEQYTLSLKANEESTREVVEGLVITTPPHGYRDWFRGDKGFDPLREMTQSSCAIVTMGFEKSSFDGAIAGTGFVITRKTKTPLTACTYISEKWPQATPKDKVVLRVFLGKPNDDTVSSHDEEQLKAIALSEIKQILHMTSEPLWQEVTRLEGSMPQYTVNHRDRIQKVRAHVKEQYKHLYLIGTPFDGVGIPDGVRQAKELCEQLERE